MLLTAVLPAFAPVWGQTPGGDPPTYFPLAKFNIPFSDPGDRRIVKVHLNVSVDRGKTYQSIASARPGDRNFQFTAQGDGLYYFTTQTEDIDGHLYPADPRLAPPMIMVVVDTKKPIITLKQAQAREGSVSVEWDIRDENLDANSLRADYRPVGGQNWIPLPVDRRAFGSYEWNAGMGQYEVRFQVSDLAKNAAEQAITLGASVKPGMGTVPSTPPGMGTSGVAPANDSVRWVRKRDFHLDYTLEEGPSGVPKIEIWQCSPSLEWQLKTTVEKAKPPLALKATSEGRFGFTLIPVSGVDLAMPRPVRGDQPQVWIEVDETAPRVRIERIEVGRGADSGDVTISWDATDNRQLSAKPISIFYSDKAEGGEWKPIALGLPNSRSYVWPRTETKPYQFYIKVEATDMAGNPGQDVSRDPVKVDLKIPKISIGEVKAVPPAPTVTPKPPSGSPP